MSKIKEDCSMIPDSVCRKLKKEKEKENINELKKNIAKFCENEHIEILLNESVYHDKKYDVTDKLIQYLDNSKPSKGSY